MNTPFTQEDVIYTVLNGSALKTALTGLIIKGGDIFDYSKENVTIKSLLMGTGDIQNGVLNVNIHVPDINVTVGGITKKQRNSIRLKALTEIAVQAIESNSFGADYNFWISNTNAFEVFQDVDGIDNHFINIRIEFKFHNSNK